MSKEVDPVSIPVVEEELKLGRREVETGRVRVRTIPEERTEMVSETLQHSEAEVERVFINREISELPTVREEGNTVVVPVIEERLVKRLFLVEEVRLTRQVVSERIEQPVKLRSQRVVVERKAVGGEASGEE